MSLRVKEFPCFRYRGDLAVDNSKLRFIQYLFSARPETTLTIGMVRRGAYNNENQINCPSKGRNSFTLIRH